MANDRIYIKCKGCGDTLYIGKSMGAGFYYPGYTKPLEKSLNDFYDEHTFCCGHDEGDFEIVYESEKTEPKPEVQECKVCIQTPTWCPLMKEN